MVNIFAAVPKIMPSACVQVGRSVFCRNGSYFRDISQIIGIYSKQLMWYNDIKGGAFMKPFLGIDLTTDKKNEQFNGTEFLVMKPSSAMAQSFEQSFKKAEETVERSKLPLPLRITQLICGGLGAISAAGIIRGLGTVSLNQAYKNAPWVFWLGGICLLIWGILKIISTLKEKALTKPVKAFFKRTNISNK